MFPHNLVNWPNGLSIWNSFSWVHWGSVKMKHFQFSPLRSKISSSSCTTSCLRCKNRPQHVAKRGPGLKLARHNPHIWFTIAAWEELHDFQASSSDYKETMQPTLHTPHCSLFSHILLDFMTLVKMQPLNIHVWGLSPVKQLPPLSFCASFRESEKLFDFNWQELNIKKEALGVRQSVDYSFPISSSADMSLAFLAFILIVLKISHCSETCRVN